jgi:hypothetical protein
LREDGTIVVHGNVGRIHEAFPLSSASVGRVSAPLRDTYDLDGNGSFETVFLTPGSTSRNSDREFDPNLHQAHVDETIIGYRQQLPSQVFVEANWIHRTFRDLPTLVEVNGTYDARAFTGYRNESLNDVGLLTNDTYNWPVYSAVTLEAAKKSSVVNLLASYVRQWRHLDGTWQPNDPASLIQPDAFPNDRGLDDTRGSRTSIYNSYASTPGPQWWDHSIRVGASWNTRRNLGLATSYVFESGRWSGPILTRVSAPDPAFGSPTVTLSNGRVVSNPLATTLRFAYATRGDGQMTTSHLHIWNVRVSQTFRLRGSAFLVAADLFNVRNDGADQNFQSTSLFSPIFGLGTSRQLPRSAQLVLRYAF